MERVRLRRCPHRVGLELSTDLCEVSQYPEKTPERAVSLLKVPNCVFKLRICEYKRQSLVTKYDLGGQASQFYVHTIV